MAAIGLMGSMFPVMARAGVVVVLMRPDDQAGIVCCLAVRAIPMGPAGAMVRLRREACTFSVITDGNTKALNR